MTSAGAVRFSKLRAGPVWRPFEESDKPAGASGEGGCRKAGGRADSVETSDLHQVPADQLEFIACIKPGHADQYGFPSGWNRDVAGIGDHRDGAGDGRAAVKQHEVCNVRWFVDIARSGEGAKLVHHGQQGCRTVAEYGGRNTTPGAGGVGNRIVRQNDVDFVVAEVAVHPAADIGVQPLQIASGDGFKHIVPDDDALLVVGNLSELIVQDVLNTVGLTVQRAGIDFVARPQNQPGQKGRRHAEDHQDRGQDRSREGLLGFVTVDVEHCTLRRTSAGTIPLKLFKLVTLGTRFAQHSRQSSRSGVVLEQHFAILGEVGEQRQRGAAHGPCRIADAAREQAEAGKSLAIDPGDGLPRSCR